MKSRSAQSALQRATAITSTDDLPGPRPTASAADAEAGPRQMRLFETSEPGESVQVDVTFVKIAGRWAFQYTALDDCTQFRVLRLYRRLHQNSSLAFLAELCRTFPFPIRPLQCDGGHELPFAFALAVQTLGIQHRYIKPRRPQQNGTVERSHRIDQKEFWGRARFADFDAAAVGLRALETRYNHQRFPLADASRKAGNSMATSSRITPCPRPPPCTAGLGSILTRSNTSSRST